MTGAQQLIEMGKQQGIQQGMQQGIQQGVQQGIQRGMQQGIQQGMQQGIERGIERGIQRGMQQGTLEGERTILKKQLMWRFSAIPNKYLEKIDHADTAELENFAKKFLEAKTLRDIFENYH